MKKVFLFASLLSIALSCKDDDDKKVETPKPAMKVYFAEYSPKRVGVMDLSNTGEFTTLADNAGKGLNSPTGIVIDQVNNKLYIAEEGGSRIVRLNQDGSGDLEVLYDESDGVSEPTSIAIDVANHKIYWANSGTDQIMRGDFDGTTEVATLFDGATVVDYSYGMTIDLTKKKIYFSDFGDDYQISVGNLDGTGTASVLYDNLTEFIGCPSNILVDGDKLYWSDECDGNIAVANADGTGTPQLLFGEADGVTSADGIGIDKVSNKIYWSETDNGVIARGNLDGSGEREVLLENVEPYYIALEFKE
jgi:DNA-binding beta-propeller fold protein YncE